jgi:hypothetical protein
MGKKVIYTGRQFILWIIALQMLNLSVGSAFSWDNEYDYSYTYNKTYDPTETAVEWIVELNCGQQPSFSYDMHQDGGKCLLKTFHWKTDLQPGMPEPVVFVLARRPRIEIPTRPLVEPVAETVSPPPECPVI